MHRVPRAIPAPLLMMVLGYALGGMNGLYWGGAVGWVVGFAGMCFMDTAFSKRADAHEEATKQILSAVTLRPTSANDQWSDIKQLLRHNPKITPAYLDERAEKEAVTWLYMTEGQLPTCDMDLLNAMVRFGAAQSAAKAPAST